MKYVNEKKSSLRSPLLSRAIMVAFGVGVVSGSTVIHWLLAGWVTALCLITLIAAFGKVSIPSRYAIPLLTLDCVLLYLASTYIPGAYVVTMYGVMMIAYAYTIIFNRK